LNATRVFGNATLHLGDCLELMKAIPDASVDLILTDPPYFKVKNEPWDNQWSKPGHFLSWLDQVLAQFQRILKPNGSLYLFASPQMAARVEILIGERFNVLNSIRWHKAGGWHKKVRKEDLCRYLQPWEACVFAEKVSEDLSPISAKIRSARIASGLKATEVDVLLGNVRSSDPTRGTELCRRWEEGSSIPTEDSFVRAMAACGEQSDSYQELVGATQAWRRPFSVSVDVPHTDQWTFDPVRPYPGKHPCEKPSAMLEHIITASSRPGDVVFDAFTGTGSTGIAAVKLGRDFIGCEMSEQHHADAISRIARVSKPQEIMQLDLLELAEV